MAVLTTENEESQYQNGVKRLHESGISKVPSKYILPVLERPNITKQQEANVTKNNLKLPIIDFHELQGPNRPQVLESLASACEQYGFFQVSLNYVLLDSENFTLKVWYVMLSDHRSGPFYQLIVIKTCSLHSDSCEWILMISCGLMQLVNHGIPSDVVSNMIDVGTKFFELPFEERAKYMSSDMRAPVRYGTSFNQNKDRVFCWRDFLKLMCHPLPDVLPHWPSSPVDMRWELNSNHLLYMVLINLS